MTSRNGWRGPPVDRAPSSPKRKELTCTLSVHCTLCVYYASTMMGKSNDSVCSFSPSPLTHRQLNCQTPFPGSSFSRASTEFIHGRNPLLPYFFIYFSRRKAIKTHAQCIADTQSTQTTQVYVHTQHITHTHTHTQGMILFCFCFFRSLKWLTNTRTLQCLPQFSSLSLSLVPSKWGCGVAVLVDAPRDWVPRLYSFLIFTPRYDICISCSIYRATER